MYVFMQKITVLIWQGNSKAPKNYKPFTLEAECKWLIFLEDILRKCDYSALSF